ncbi:triose-phosphate isomerase [Anderseniella sp. Alg231-50]|uniref:triose-phosphate isomerase n=1 Tax=Anderseniella sp. Alg231-50 TaxID=1922226 RepID=UPI000D54D59E
MKPLAAGNWKMNGLKASVSEINALKDSLDGAAPACDVMICPPATLVLPLADAAAGSAVQIGAQDCHTAVSGAHTGDISAAMLKDAGAAAVIVGHSERRADHGETSELVKTKAEAAIAAGLTAIVCLGETLAEREAGDTLSVVHAQLNGSLPGGATGATTVIAYEPVWAIGSGLTPTADQVAEVHQAIRAGLSALTSAEEAHSIRILYGGSVKPSNAAELMAIDNVDGALVGGASLAADDFAGIIAAF